jgi:hypothetical protein
VDTEGNRTKPMCNRIRVPLQVSEITTGESVIMASEALKAITSYLQNHEALHRLVRDPKKAENQEKQSNSIGDKLFQLVFFPVLDSIEIQEIQRND